jgi:DNA modification methylase
LQLAALLLLVLGNIWYFIKSKIQPVIFCHGLDFADCELDSEYFEAAEKRYQNFIAQLRMF